mmetsp:Transcript_7710/g.11132  ORF Transcript_7710/g.11132 Transcript_7710/m.11132 type:complete len:86 (+) Transcript_7710:94-351(+)
MYLGVIIQVPTPTSIFLQPHLVLGRTHTKIPKGKFRRETALSEWVMQSASQSLFDFAWTDSIFCFFNYMRLHSFLVEMDDLFVEA